MLDASLESMNFSSSHGFEFGTRSRDYGFFPKSHEDINQWYKLYIEYAVYLVISESPAATRAKSLLASQFRGLWIKAEMYDELETAAKTISEKFSWGEGWTAVRTTKRFDGKDMDAKVYSRLDNLDAVLKPNTLIEKVKLYALSSFRGVLDLVDTVENQDEEEIDEYSYVEQITQSLGYEVGSLHYEVFIELLPDILSLDGVRLFNFGQGLANGCTNPDKMWRDFCEQLALIDEPKRNYKVLRGFLNVLQIKDENCSEAFLDEALSDSVLSIAYPYLQTGVKINKQGVERLKKSLEIGASPIWQYCNLAYGRVHATIEDCDLCELLSLIATKVEGTEVSIEILNMRLHGCIKEDSLSDVLISTGQELLLKYEFKRRNSMTTNIDYELANIIKSCLLGKTAQETACVLCNRLAEAIVKYEIYYMDYSYVFKALAEIKPEVFLDAFLGCNSESGCRTKQVFSDTVRMHDNPLFQIDDKVMVTWCEVNPGIRYPIAASFIVPFHKCKTSDSLEWTPLAIQMINNSPNPIMVLDEFKSTFNPTSWSGSRAEIMQTRLSLIAYLKEHENSAVADWARREEKKFEKEICTERERELKREIERNESFE